MLNTVSSYIEIEMKYTFIINLQNNPRTTDPAKMRHYFMKNMAGGPNTRDCGKINNCQ